MGGEVLPPSLRTGVEAAAVRSALSSGAAGAQQLQQAGLTTADLDPPLSLNKAWHAVHFVLAHTQFEPTAPPGNAVLGGREVGPDLGCKTSPEPVVTS